jgi:hypothetical protein
MCDFICLENIKPLVANIVTKHFSQKAGHVSSATSSSAQKDSLSLDEIANPYVDTFRQLQKVYEDNTNANGTASRSEQPAGGLSLQGDGANGDAPAVMNGSALSTGGISLNKKALEDQVRTRLSSAPTPRFFDRS